LPRNLPDSLRDRPHQVGEFPVQFFGSLDYFWVHIGRCFTFAEGDESSKSSKSTSSQKKLALAFDNGVRQAKVAFAEVEHLKLARSNKSGTNGGRTSKYNFQVIKTSRPYGNVSISRTPLDDLPKCDCDPKGPNPCGTDDCMNRALRYECHPAICAAGERCQNQRFMKRIYPKQVPIPAGDRGWGLKCVKDIKKGDFVNEYVGEIIDDDECKRRLELAYKNDVCNFYFLTIDKDRFVLLIFLYMYFISLIIKINLKSYRCRAKRKFIEIYKS
jgi:histone-lysine N-methyltransferase NSD2